MSTTAQHAPSTASGRGGSGPGSSTRCTARNDAGPLFAAPFLILFLLLFLVPLGYAAYLSLFREQLVGGTRSSASRTTSTALERPAFRSGVGRVALFFVIQVPVMLHRWRCSSPWRSTAGCCGWPKVFRLGIFVPYAVPSVVAALMWGYLYGPDFGPFAQLSRHRPAAAGLPLRQLDARRRWRTS